MSHKPKSKISSNRNFGLVFSFVFLIISLWPLLNGSTIRIWSIFIAIVFLILGLINSNLLKPLNILWFKFGVALGAIVAPITMGFVFFAVVTPTGFIMKLLGKDLLNSKYNKNKKTYWITQNKLKGSMKQQF